MPTSGARFSRWPRSRMGVCSVSLTHSEGINHAFEVDADSLYEAVSEFRRDETTTVEPGAMTEFIFTA